jgi:hypothetical protein
VFGGEKELIVTGYIDASLQTDTNDSKSQSGFVFCLNEGTVSRKNFKQDIVTDLMTEDEYTAASEATKEIILIRNFISELGVVPSASSLMDLYLL